MNNVAYYEMIKDLQRMVEELQLQHKEATALLNEGYEKKYQQLGADRGYGKFISAHNKRESVLKLEIEDHKNIAKLLEEENNALREELR